jgi:hypothetical protein
MKTVSVRFGHAEGDKTYDYKLAPPLLDNALGIKPGDKLVVQVGQNSSCSVGIVTAVHDTPSESAKLWALQLVDDVLNVSLPRA